MAVDWIKMRTDLYRDPKVCVIADFLLASGSELAAYVNQNKQRDMTVTRNVMRNAVVGALVTVWGVTRHRGKRNDNDLVIHGCTLNVVDDVADLPGFGDAMSKVGWAVESSEGVVFPHFFEEYNVDPSDDAKLKAAERQRRYREKRKLKSDVTSDVTVAPQSDIEKRREENNNNTPLKPPKGGGGAHQRDAEIYAAYPRHVGKRAALRAISNARKRLFGEGNQHPGEYLLAKVTQYAAIRREVEGSPYTHTPHPATWFNQGRYDDDPAQWRVVYNEQRITAPPAPPVTLTPSAPSLTARVVAWSQKNPDAARKLIEQTAPLYARATPEAMAEHIEQTLRAPTTAGGYCMAVDEILKREAK